MDIVQNHIIEMIIASFFGVMAFLVHHYFISIRRGILDVHKDVAKLEGRLDALQSDVRSHSVELTRAITELKAVWRWIDAPKRATDNINGDYP